MAASLVLLMLSAEARVESGIVQLGTTDATSGSKLGWQYIGKFGYALGSGTYEVTVKAPNTSIEIDLEINLILDEMWPQVAGLQSCSRELRKLSKTKHNVKVGQDWSAPVRGGMTQNMRPHIWYFALSACGTDFTSTPIHFNLHAKQEDKSELSVELRHMSAAISLVVFCLSAFLLDFTLRCRRIQREKGLVHPVIWVLAISVVLTWGSQVLHLLHLRVYEVKGTSESGLEAAADMAFMLSQVVSSALLIVIANGFSLLEEKHDVLASMKSVVAGIALLHMALVVHSKLTGDHADKHHENGGVAGWALVAVRLLLWIWFVTRASALKKRSFRLEGFLLRFRLAGSLYFLAYPVICILAKVFASYLQHPIMYLGLVAMQVGSSFWLSRLFLGKGHFYEVSALSGSLLPGSPRGSPCNSPRLGKLD